MIREPQSCTQDRVMCVYYCISEFWQFTIEICFIKSQRIITRESEYHSFISVICSASCCSTVLTWAFKITCLSLTGVCRLRLSVGRALLSQCGIHLIILIKNIIYSRYVIIAYCFIMYYNSEVQISGTICTK